MKIVYNFLFWKLSIGITVLLRGMRKDSVEMPKCLRNANKSMRVTLHYLSSSPCNFCRGWKFRPSVESSDPPRHFVVSSEKMLSACYFVVGRKFQPPHPHTHTHSGGSVYPPTKGSQEKNSVTRQKFRPYVESSDKHIKRPVTTTFWGSGINTPHPLIHLLLSPRAEHLLNLPKLLLIPYKS